MSGTDFLVEVTKTIGKGMPWAKMTAPMLPVLIAIYFCGQVLLDLHKFNIQNNVIDAFPTSSAWWTFMVTNIIIIAVYLGLSVWHFYRNPRMGR